MTFTYSPILIFSLPVLVLLAFYLAGKLILAPFEGSGLQQGGFTFFNTLLYTLAGAIGVVSIYAIIRARGISVNLYFILLFLILLARRVFIRKQSFSFRLRWYENETRLLAFTVLALVLLVITQLVRYDYFSSEIFKAGHSDFFYYVSTAEKMRRYHIEGINFESIPAFDPKHYRLPYHYFDLWLNALMQEITALDKTSIYLYMVTPITGVLCFLGMAAVYSVYDQKSFWVNFGVAFVVVFYFSVLPFKSGAFFRNAVILPKIFPAIVLSATAFVLLYRKQTVYAFLALTAMPVMNVLAAPAVLLSIGLAGVYELIRKKYDRAVTYWAICLFLLFFFIAFYLTWGNITGTAVAKMPAAMVFLKEAIRILFRDYLARMWLYLLPFIFFIAVNYKLILQECRAHRELYGFYGFLFLAGISFSGMFNFFVDAWQFDYFPSYAALLVFLTAFIALYLGRRNPGTGRGFLPKLSFLAIILQMLFAFYSSFRPENTNPESIVSRSFIQEIKERLPEKSIGGLLYNESLFRGSEWAYNPFVFQGGYFMGLVPESRDLVLLSLPADIAGDRKYETGAFSLIRSSEFFSFIKNDYAREKTADDYQFDYIRERKIGYLILEKDVLLGDRVKSIVKDTLQDKLSGTRFVLLKNL